jgi:hypothetical protein
MQDKEALEPLSRIAIGYIELLDSVVQKTENKLKELGLGTNMSRAMMMTILSRTIVKWIERSPFKNIKKEEIDGFIDVFKFAAEERERIKLQEQ